MERKLLGYNERPLEVNGIYDYINRSYIFDPIYEAVKGYIVTQAVMLCRECSSIIKFTGGPSLRSICLKCYPSVKLHDFTEGHQHVIEDQQ